MDKAVKLYNDVSANCSELITKRYSTSFSLGINTLHKSIHEHIYNIYGFVRFADEIVDTFHDLDKKKVLNQFEKDTFETVRSILLGLFHPSHPPPPRGRRTQQHRC